MKRRRKKKKRKKIRFHFGQKNADQKWEIIKVGMERTTTTTTTTTTNEGIRFSLSVTNCLSSDLSLTYNLQTHCKTYIEYIAWPVQERCVSVSAACSVQFVKAPTLHSRFSVNRRASNISNNIGDYSQTGWPALVTKNRRRFDENKWEKEKTTTPTMARYLCYTSLANVRAQRASGKGRFSFSSLELCACVAFDLVLSSQWLTPKVTSP